MKKPKRKKSVTKSVTTVSDVELSAFLADSFRRIQAEELNRQSIDAFGPATNSPVGKVTQAYWKVGV